MEEIWLLTLFLFGSCLFAGCGVNNPVTLDETKEVETTEKTVHLNRYELRKR